MISHLIFKKPVLLVGNGVRLSNATELLYEFSKKTHIPILTTLNAVDLAQDNFHIGFIGTHGNRIANMIINQSDLVISIGARLDMRQVGSFNNSFAKGATLVRCDIDQNELDKNIRNDEIKYQMDAKMFFNELLNDNIGDFSNWLKSCYEAKKILDKYDITEGNLIIKEINKLLPINPIISIDVGQNQCWAAQSLHLKGLNGRIFISGGLGIMGCSIPFAIGASIANRKSKVYCIVGDGGVQMNIQELETIHREKLPIKIIVLNNKVLGKIYENQRSGFNGRYANTAEIGGYTVPDFEKIGNAYMIKSTTILSYKDLNNYKAWFDDNEPCLINIIMNEDTYLYPIINWETNETRPNLDHFIIEKVNDILNIG